MKESPIIFSTELIPAILDNRKTQTRRVVKPQPVDAGCVRMLRANDWNDFNGAVFFDGPDPQSRGNAVARSPFGGRGDRLWVKEAWAYCIKCGDRRLGNPDGALYRADSPDCGTCHFVHPTTGEPDHDGRWRSPRFMPRWASRITLEIIDVHVERLQDITVDDAIAEGVIGTDAWDAVTPEEIRAVSRQHPPGIGTNESIDRSWGDYTIIAMRHLWEGINARRGYPWGMNPWVWRIAFRRIAEKRTSP